MKVFFGMVNSYKLTSQCRFIIPGIQDLCWDFALVQRILTCILMHHLPLNLAIHKFSIISMTIRPLQTASVLCIVSQMWLYIQQKFKIIVVN